MLKLKGLVWEHNDLQLCYCCIYQNQLICVNSTFEDAGRLHIYSGTKVAGMELLLQIAKAIDQSKLSWIQVASLLGIDQNDILKIKKHRNSTKEFVSIITYKLWKELLEFVNVPTNSVKAFTDITNIDKLANILTGSYKVSSDKEKSSEFDVISEIAERIAEWRIFARILNLEESYISLLQAQSLTPFDRNLEVMKKFAGPLKGNSSWVFWRQYLNQFDNGKLVIKELELAFPHLISQVHDTGTHLLSGKRLSYFGHPFVYKALKSTILNKSENSIAVRVGTEEFECTDYQSFSDWVKTQEQYVDRYDLIHDIIAVNFADMNEKYCPILNTIEDFLINENDSGFVAKGYHFINHISLLKPGLFAKDIFDEHYFCFFVNDGIVLYITRATKGTTHALYESTSNIEIANVLHEELKTNSIMQINVIVYESPDEYEFCNSCIDHGLFLHEEVFMHPAKFLLWYKRVAERAKEILMNKLPQVSASQTESICREIKADMFAYEALENIQLPSFSYAIDDQVDELKRLILLTPLQYKALNADDLHIILRGSYGSGKSLVLLKRLERIIDKVNETDIIYLICNDQQSAYVHFLRLFKKEYPERYLIVCKSNDITSGEVIPKLSVILQHIHSVWEGKTVHVFIDEFNASYITKSEVKILEGIMQYFTNSHIVVSLQSMEENIVDVEKNFEDLDIGYQFDLLCEKTSFSCFKLSFSLRCSLEISQFIKITSKVMESSVSLSSLKNYESYGAIVDKEHGMEKDSKGNKEAIKTKFSFNQDSNAGHRVSSGPVRVYLFDKTKSSPPLDISVTYITALKYILENADEYERYVICTYNEDLYNAVYFYLEESSYDWTCDIKEFTKESVFNVLLTEYASVRGFEFSNFIFLVPLGAKFLKYRMIECFSRATTNLHVITDNSKIWKNKRQSLFFTKWVKENSLDHQILNSWKESDVVKLINIKYDHVNQICSLLEGDKVLFTEMVVNNFAGRAQKYPWNRKPDEFHDGHHSFSGTWLGIGYILDCDNLNLLREYITIQKIDLNIEENQRHLLNMASKRGAENICRMVVTSSDFDVNICDNERKYPLHLACLSGSSEIVQLLIDHQADVNIKDIHGETALHKAASCGHVYVVKILLRNGANVNMGDKHGNTALYFATVYDHVSVVKLLIENQQSRFRLNDIDETLRLAKTYKRNDIINYLVNYRAEVNKLSIYLLPDLFLD